MLPVTDVTSFDVTKDDRKEQKKAKVQNVLAMSYLTLTLNVLTLLKMIPALRVQIGRANYHVILLKSSQRIIGQMM